MAVECEKCSGKLTKKDKKLIMYIDNVYVLKEMIDVPMGYVREGYDQCNVYVISIIKCQMLYTQIKLLKVHKTLAKCVLNMTRKCN